MKPIDEKEYRKSSTMKNSILVFNIAFSLALSADCALAQLGSTYVPDRTLPADPAQGTLGNFLQDTSSVQNLGTIGHLIPRASLDFSQDTPFKCDLSDRDAASAIQENSQTGISQTRGLPVPMDLDAAHGFFDACSYELQRAHEEQGRLDAENDALLKQMDQKFIQNSTVRMNTIGGKMKQNYNRIFLQSLTDTFLQACLETRKATTYSNSPDFEGSWVCFMIDPNTHTPFPSRWQIRRTGLNTFNAETMILDANQYERHSCVFLKDLSEVCFSLQSPNQQKIDFSVSAVNCFALAGDVSMQGAQGRKESWPSFWLRSDLVLDTVLRQIQDHLEFQRSITP